MPENVPPKETAKADALNPKEQAPGVPRGSITGPDVAPLPGTAGPARTAAPVTGAPDDNPGPGFVRIRWVNKIGGTEADEEWAEERRARNLVGSGHAEIVEQKDGGRK